MAKKNKNQEGLVPSPGQALAVIPSGQKNNGNGDRRLPWWLWALAILLLPLAPFFLLVRWIAGLFHIRLPRFQRPRRPQFGWIRRIFSAVGRFFGWLTRPITWFAEFLRTNWHLIFWVLMAGFIGATLYLLHQHMYLPSAYATLFSYIFGTVAYRFMRYAQVPEEDREQWRRVNARFSGVFIFFAIALFFLILFTIFYRGQ